VPIVSRSTSVDLDIIARSKPPEHGPVGSIQKWECETLDLFDPTTIEAVNRNYANHRSCSVTSALNELEAFSDFSSESFWRRNSRPMDAELGP
jgi:hypothetical protein